MNGVTLYFVSKHFSSWPILGFKPLFRFYERKSSMPERERERERQRQRQREKQRDKEREVRVMSCNFQKKSEVEIFYHNWLQN